jgi:hypothetical protein
MESYCSLCTLDTIHRLFFVTRLIINKIENFRRHGATPRFCLHVVSILIIEIVLQTCCFVMWYINIIFIKFIEFTTYEIVLI